MISHGLSQLGKPDLVHSAQGLRRHRSGKMSVFPSQRPRLGGGQKNH